MGAKIIIGLLRGKTQPGQGPALVEAGGESRRSKSARSPPPKKGETDGSNRLTADETDLVNTVASGLDLIDRVGAENLGLLLDTFHMNIEEADIGAAIRQANASYFPFSCRRFQPRAPGGGYLDFKSILHGLSEAGYRGYLSGEFYATARSGQR